MVNINIDNIKSVYFVGAGARKFFTQRKTYVYFWHYMC